MARDLLRWDRPFQTVRARGFQTGNIVWFPESGKLVIPLGNALNYVDVSNNLNVDAAPRNPSEKTGLAKKFHQAIGLSLGIAGRREFVTDLNGSVYLVDLDGGDKKMV